MISNQLLVEAISQFESTLKRSAKLAGNDPVQAVDLRRKIAVHRTTIAALSSRPFGTPSFELEFRGRFSELCSVIALHQSAWPIVCVDRQDPAYVDSVTKMRQCYTTFFDWVRQTSEASPGRRGGQ